MKVALIEIVKVITITIAVGLAVFLSGVGVIWLVGR